MTTITDHTQMSRDELIKLVLAQALQIAKLQAEIDAARLKLEKGRKPEIISALIHQPPSQVPKGNALDQLKKPEHGLPQLPSDAVIDIKPKWRTTNRLQNCHKPKPN